MNQSTRRSLQQRCEENRSTIAMACDAMAADCEAAAHELVDEFRARRKELQADDEARRTAEAGTARRKVYAPLSLFARYHHSNLQLFWQQVHRPRGSTKPVYKYMPKGRRGRTGYDLQALQAVAKDFEKELVREIELRADDIRKQWRQVAAIRMANRVETVRWKASEHPVG